MKLSDAAMEKTTGQIRKTSRRFSYKFGLF